MRAVRLPIGLAAGGVSHEGQACPLPEPARMTLRLARSIELLCETFQLLGQNALIPAARDAQLSCRDGQRIHAARRLIETRWQEKLTLDIIAAACGLNRSKLARGFRDLFVIRRPALLLAATRNSCKTSRMTWTKHLTQSGQMLPR